MASPIYTLGNKSPVPINLNGGANQKQGQPYILDLVTLEWLYFQNIPQEVEYDPKAEWIAIASAGRNNPGYQYLGGDDTLSFTLSWYSNDATRQDVWRAIKWLESLSRNDSYTNKPHLVQCVWGDMFRDSRWIVHSAGPVRPSLFDRENGMMPRLATQNVVLKRVTLTNTSIEQIRSIFF
jgi:hypothetical protein